MNDVAGTAILGETDHRILDAALLTFIDLGISRVSMETIAKAAGVSRMTLHRRFGSRDALVGAVIAREAQNVFGRVDEAIRSVDSIEDQIATAFAIIVREGRNHELLQRLLVLEPDTTLPQVTLAFAPILTIAARYLAAHLRRGQTAGLLPDYDADVVAELLVRVTHSLILTPGGAIDVSTDAAAIAFARRYLVPIALGLANEPTPRRSGAKPVRR